MAHCSPRVGLEYVLVWVHPVRFLDAIRAGYHHWYSCRLRCYHHTRSRRRGMPSRRPHLKRWSRSRRSCIEVALGAASGMKQPARQRVHHPDEALCSSPKFALYLSDIHRLVGRGMMMIENNRVMMLVKCFMTTSLRCLGALSTLILVSLGHARVRRPIGECPLWSSNGRQTA